MALFQESDYIFRKLAAYLSLMYYTVSQVTLLNDSAEVGVLSEH